MQNNKWAPAVVLIDAAYLDRVAEDLTRNFSRMIGRPISKADLCHWLDCIALDSGLRPGNNDLQAHFLYPKEMKSLNYFEPSSPSTTTWDTSACSHFP